MCEGLGTRLHTAQCTCRLPACAVSLYKTANANWPHSCFLESSFVAVKPHGIGNGYSSWFHTCFWTPNSLFLEQPCNWKYITTIAWNSNGWDLLCVHAHGTVSFPSLPTIQLEGLGMSRSQTQNLGPRLAVLPLPWVPQSQCRWLREEPGSPRWTAWSGGWVPPWNSAQRQGTTTTTCTVN